MPRTSRRPPRGGTDVPGPLTDEYDVDRWVLTREGLDPLSKLDEDDLRCGVSGLRQTPARPYAPLRGGRQVDSGCEEQVQRIQRRNLGGALSRDPPEAGVGDGEEKNGVKIGYRSIHVHRVSNLDRRKGLSNERVPNYTIGTGFGVNPWQDLERMWAPCDGWNDAWSSSQRVRRGRKRRHRYVPPVLRPQTTRIHGGYACYWIEGRPWKVRDSENRKPYALPYNIMRKNGWLLLF